MLKQKYFLTDFFILSAEKQPIKLSWRNIEWLLMVAVHSLLFMHLRNLINLNLEIFLLKRKKLQEILNALLMSIYRCG